MKQHKVFYSRICGSMDPDFLCAAKAPMRKLRYLEMVKPSEGAPSDQLNNHGWILGGTNRVSWTAQADIDMLLDPRSEN